MSIRDLKDVIMDKIQSIHSLEEHNYNEIWDLLCQLESEHEVNI